MTTKSDDIQMGEVYIARNRVTNMAYIGQARKYLSSGQKWGTHGRWTRHLHEAFCEDKPGYNTSLNQAIRSHGRDSFDVVKLQDCSLDELDYYEQKYIKDFNTLDPDGYNMTVGGKTGGHSETSNAKKHVTRKAYSQAAKDNMGRASLGRRYEQKERMYTEDSHLPKYIYAIRDGANIIGYQVKKYPLGVEKKEYVYKTFKRKYDLPGALEDAKKCIAELDKEYGRRLAEHQAKIVQEKKSQEAAEELKLPELPENIHHFVVNDQRLGYYVKGLRDYKNDPIPRRDFTEHSHSINLDHALRFVAEVNRHNAAETAPDDWMTMELPKKSKAEQLPKYIRPQYFNGQEIGYRIDFFVKYDENKKKVMIVKSFCNKKKTMEEKLAMAKECLAELLETYKKTTNE